MNLHNEINFWRESSDQRIRMRGRAMNKTMLSLRQWNSNLHGWFHRIGPLAHEASSIVNIPPSFPGSERLEKAMVYHLHSNGGIVPSNILLP